MKDESKCEEKKGGRVFHAEGRRGVSNQGQDVSALTQEWETLEV